MDNAIKKGMIKATPIPAHDTVSFSISAVVDPKTGKELFSLEPSIIRSDCCCSCGCTVADGCCL